MQDRIGFLHNDFNLRNILLIKTPPIILEFNNKNYEEVYYIPYIVDFDDSTIGNTITTNNKYTDISIFQKNLFYEFYTREDFEFPENEYEYDIDSEGLLKNINDPFIIFLLKLINYN